MTPSPSQSPVRASRRLRMPAASPSTTWQTHAKAEQRLSALASVCDRLTHDFGTWRVPWGDLNRYQRVTGAVGRSLRGDALPRSPSPRRPGVARVGADLRGTAGKYYGTSGSSFVAIVATRSARAVEIGGEGGSPGSAHFAIPLCRGPCGRRKRFYPEELDGHVGDHPVAGAPHAAYFQRTRPPPPRRGAKLAPAPAHGDDDAILEE